MFEQQAAIFIWIIVIGFPTVAIGYIIHYFMKGESKQKGVSK